MFNYFSLMSYYPFSFVSFSCSYFFYAAYERVFVELSLSWITNFYFKLTISWTLISIIFLNLFYNKLLEVKLTIASPSCRSFTLLSSSVLAFWNYLLVCNCFSKTLTWLNTFNAVIPAAKTASFWAPFDFSLYFLNY